MVSLIFSIRKLLLAFASIIKQEDTRALLTLMATTLLLGTLFYHRIEKLKLLDAFYFSFITLTTIGYGDIHPVTDLGKLFTVIYAMLGLGLMALFISTVAKHYLGSKYPSQQDFKE